MKRMILCAVVAAAALAGCKPASETPAAANGNTEVNDAAEANATGNAAAGENVVTKVLAMNDKQRNVVFIRAILDAGLSCEGVESSTRLPDSNGLPLWRANCVHGDSHMIQITPDGTANIVSRTDGR